MLQCTNAPGAKVLCAMALIVVGGRHTGASDQVFRSITMLLTGGFYCAAATSGVPELPQ